MAMPWSRAKAIAADYRSGARDTKNLTALFDACFRIQREASEAAGRHIPLVVENVKGAQAWVGRAGWHYGSFYLWGDIPALMPITVRCVTKTVGLVQMRDGANHTRHLTNQAEHEGYKTSGMNWSGRTKTGQDFTRIAGNRAIKNNGGSWFGIGSPGQKETNRNPVTEGVKQAGISGVRANGKGDRWFQDGAAKSGSKSKARKAASAAIAKIPFVLAQHIARMWKPL